MNGHSLVSRPSATKTEKKYTLATANASLSRHANEKEREREREVVSEGLRESQTRQTKREQHGDRKRGRRETDEAQLRGSEGWSRQNRQISRETNEEDGNGAENRKQKQKNSNHNDNVQLCPSSSSSSSWTRYVQMWTSSFSLFHVCLHVKKWSSLLLGMFHQS